MIMTLQAKKNCVTVKDFVLAAVTDTDYVNNDGQINWDAIELEVSGAYLEKHGKMPDSEKVEAAILNLLLQNR